MRQWTIALTPFAIISMLAGIYGCKELYTPTSGIASSKAIYQKDAEAFFKEFETDEEKANELYTGKVISVKGKIIQVTEGDNMQTVLLGEDSGVNGVMCRLEPGQKPVSEELKPGLVIQFKGVCTGLFMDVVLVQCVRERTERR